MLSLQETTQFIEKNWSKKSGLIAAEILLLAITVPVLTTNTNLPPWMNLIIPVVIGAVIFIFWFFTTKPPKVPTGRIGFLVCITCKDKQELEIINEDFIVPLRNLIKSGKTGKTFHFIEIRQHLAKNVIDTDSANELRIRCNAHFMIYGRVRRRTINNKENHVIELEGAVAHQPISDQVRDNLAAEFSELLPRSVHIPLENDMFAFQFTSEWAGIVARYIIGIAASYSGDTKYAEDLYHEVLLRLQNKDSSFPIFRKLKERIPARLADIYEAEASACYLKWANTYDLECLQEVENCLDKIDPKFQNRQSCLVLKAIILFLTKRSVEESIRLLKKVKAHDNKSWQCNMAFLYGYKGNLKQATRHYRFASKCNYEQNTLYQVEDFINWVIEQEPSKFQLYYCLGFINMEIKGDQVLALENFENFLKFRSDSYFLQEKELAEKWVYELSIQPELCR